MAQTLFSPSWYRVANLRPTLRKQIAIHRHDYRGRPWHVIEDRSNEQHHRFTPASYAIIGLMDGRRTVDEIWRAALTRLGDDAPSQDELIGLLAQLHFADLLKTDAAPEVQDLFLRLQMRDQQKWLTRLGSPFAWRLPLLDPDKALDVLVPAARCLFNVWSLVVWLLVVGVGLTLASMHWAEITDRFSARVLEPWNLVALAVAYPVLKLLHEMAHALAVKAWGGRVHDIGLMFILFVPIPYVDASAASGFASKWRRAVVDSAGIMVELFVASIALMAWNNVASPMARGILFNLMLMGTVSTVLFNGNPLLKFDGYYILSDVLEIPNLAQRSQKYLAYLFKRYLWGVAGARSPVTASGERFWFLLYGPLAAIYRVFLTVSIALFLASQYLVVGVLLALWSVLLMGVLPLARAIAALAKDAELRSRGGRVWLTLAGCLGGLGALLFVVPAPFHTVAEAVSFVPPKAQVRAGAEGFLVKFLAPPGQRVTAGTPLVLLRDPTVALEERVLKAKLAALQAKLNAAEFARVVEAKLIRAEMQAVGEDLERTSERVRDQTVTATADGQFEVPNATDLPGHFFTRGALIGVVHDGARSVISAVVDQGGMGAIQQGVRRIDAWEAGELTRPHPAEMARIVPGARSEIPHMALAVEGGGSIPLDPRSGNGQLKTLSNMFHIDLRLAEGRAVPHLGQRFLVRFEHSPRPLGIQMFEKARAAVLDRFGV